ncbi:MAG: GGDEF domain-containing protein, partial [Dictyoglomus sp.]
LDKLTSDLYDSFFSSIFKKRNSFLNTIKTYALKIEDLENFKEFLSALYCFIELFLSKKFLLKAENIILKAISMLDMYSEKNLRYDKFKTNEETEQLGFIGSDLISSFKMEEIIERMAQRIPELNIKKFYIVLYEEESNIGNLKLAYIDGRILSEDYYFKISKIIPSRLYPKKTSILIVKPLFFQEKWFGHIAFEYGPKRGIIYEILRAQISAAIQGALLFEEINKLVITDPLTGLFNRRYIEEEIQKEIARSQRYERPLSVMVLDLDNFKLVNDTFGHKYGDEILKKIGETLKKSCRKVDVVGRYGGDEFVVILPETNLEKSIRVADKIIKNVEKINIATANNLKLYLSVSIGIASFPEITRNPEKLLNLADLAMYKAKRLGGRQYSIASY